MLICHLWFHMLCQIAMSRCESIATWARLVLWFLGGAALITGTSNGLPQAFDWVQNPLWQQAVDLCSTFWNPTVGIWAKTPEYSSNSCPSSSSCLVPRSVVGPSYSVVALVSSCSTLDWNAVAFPKLTKGRCGGGLVHCQCRDNKSS